MRKCVGLWGRCRGCGEVWGRCGRAYGVSVEVEGSVGKCVRMWESVKKYVGKVGNRYQKSKKIIDIR